MTLAAQTTDDPVAVFTEHPRLFLRPQRLRLLKRERERASVRWQQFETLVVGGAPMPEPGFAWALYSRSPATGIRQEGHRLGARPGSRSAPAGDRLRLVPGPADRAQRRDLTARLARAIARRRRCGGPGGPLADPRRHRPVRPGAPDPAARARRDRAPVVGAPDGRRR